MAGYRSSVSGAGGDLPGEYRYEINEATGALELWKGELKIGIQSPDGSWFRTAVSTGVGSIHLGGGESGDPAHSMSSIGQNVGFKNEAFNATPGEAVVWFPPWQGLSSDLSTEIGPTYLKFGALQAALAPNGVAHGTGVSYDFTSTMTANLCVAAVTAKAHVAYTGKITNVIRSHPKGVDLHVSSASISVNAGQNFTIEYPSLYFARTGDVLRFLMLKEDGTPLQVRRGSMNSHPWRTLRARTFEDSTLASTTGWPASRAMVTNTSGALVASPVTSSEINVLAGSTGNAGITLDDADRLVVNDAGVMRQSAMVTVWNYIISKTSGAASTVMTSNAPASRALASNASGKIAVSGTTSSELGQLSGIASDSGVTPVDGDRFIINDAGVVRQTSFSRLMDYVNSKLPGTQYLNKSPSSQSNWVREWASIQCPNGQWASKSLLIGGMEFVWSTQLANTGLLLMRTIDDTPTVSGTQIYQAIGMSTPAPTNHDIWGHTWQSTNVSITGGYQRVEMIMATRINSELRGVAFRLTAFQTGSSDLNLMCEYYGPKID